MGGNFKWLEKILLMNWTRELVRLIEGLLRYFKNKRTLSALESLIKNLDKIPIEKIEKLVEQYE